MRIKKGFTLHHVCQQHIIIADGRENIDFNHVITLTESAALLWQELLDKEFTVDDMVSILCREYDVSPAVAQKDSQALADTWIATGLVKQ